MLLRFGNLYHVRDSVDFAVRGGIVGLCGHIAGLLQTQGLRGGDLLLTAPDQALNELDGEAAFSLRGCLLCGCFLGRSLGVRFRGSLFGRGLLCGRFAVRLFGGGFLRGGLLFRSGLGGSFLSGSFLLLYGLFGRDDLLFSQWSLPP